MDDAAPAIFQALEASGFGAGIRQSVWLYPLANIGHVVSVVIFAGAIAVMDARLMGLLAATAPGPVLRGARRIAIAAFIGILTTGSVLFAAEASHLAINRVFQIKVILILLGLANVLFFEFAFGRQVAGLPPGAPLPHAARTSAMASVGLWLAVVACGRSIAYF